jgi:hypothetical protein
VSPTETAETKPGNQIHRGPPFIHQMHASVGQRHATRRAALQAYPETFPELACRVAKAEAVAPSLDAATRKLSWSAIAMKAVWSMRLRRGIPEFPSTPHAINMGF